VTLSLPSQLLDRLAGDRRGLDRALLLVAAGMVSLSFKTAPWQTLHALGWVLLLAAMVRRGRWDVPGPRRWVLPWALFAGWVLLASALGPDPEEALYDAKKLLNLLAIFFLGAVLRSATEIRRVLGAACVVSAGLSVLGIYQYLTVSDPIATRSHGVSHYMTHSGLLMITLALVLPLLTARRSLPDRLLWGYAILATLALLATLTRSAWMGLAVALGVVLLFKNPRWLLALPVLVLLPVVAVPALRERAATMVDTRTHYSNVRRLEMYRTGLRMVAAHPVLGVGGREQVVRRYDDFDGGPGGSAVAGGPRVPQETPDHLHDNVLQLAAAFGIPAVLAWLAGLAVWLREVLRRLPRRGELTDGSGGLRRDLLLASLAGGAAFLTMGLLEYNFGDSEVFVLVAFTLSIPFILGRSEERSGAA
jgi:O-antigen ligase